MSRRAEPLRIIQVGGGGMGKMWLRNIGSSPEATVVGLVDLSLEAADGARMWAGLHDLPIATSLRTLASEIDADAVVNVTVPAAHHIVNTEAMFAGLPVLSEKPLSESVSECLSMAAASELTGRLLMVSQSRRYWRTLGAFRRLLAELGPIGILTCDFFNSPHFGGFREEMPQPLLVDMAIHQFDLARFLLNAEPTSVYCDSYNPEWSWFKGHATANAIFEFDNGARFSYNGSWCSPGLETSWNGAWRASTSEGSAIWDGDNTPTAMRGSAELSGTFLDSALGSEPEELAGSLAEFVHVVRDRSTPATEVHGNVLSVAMVEAAVRSASSGRRVQIREILDDAYTAALLTERHEDVREMLESWGSPDRFLSDEHSHMGAS